MKCVDEVLRNESWENETPRADVSAGAQSFTVDILRYALISARGQSETLSYHQKSYDNVSAKNDSYRSKHCRMGASCAFRYHKKNAGASRTRNAFQRNNVEQSARATVVLMKSQPVATKFERIPETNMRMPVKTLAAAAMAAAIPLAAPVAAAPLAQPLALGNVDAGTFEQVQYRRWHRRQYRGGWYAYGAAGPRRWNYGNGSAATAPGSWRGCPGGDRAMSSGYPSWMCR